LEGRSTRILVVDSDFELAFALRTGLERQGFNVTAFESPDETISNFRINEYDLALLDIDTPQMEGLELARELIKTDPNLAICFLTAYGFEDLFRKQFSTLPLHCFIKKPVTIAEIASVIRRVLDK
jgi:DNA-binding response OmpR family regulator